VLCVPTPSLLPWVSRPCHAHHSVRINMLMTFMQVLCKEVFQSTPAGIPRCDIRGLDCVWIAVRASPPLSELLRATGPEG
jgi:hypothetical protein